MRGTVKDALITGDAVVLAVDAESKTFVNVLNVATVTLRLPKDVKIKGQLDYAELTPAGLLYVSRSDASTNGEANIIDLASGEPKYKDAVEGTKSSAMLHAADGRTLYVFAGKDRHLYAIDRQDGTYHAVGGEIKLQGDEDPTALEVRPAGVVLSSSQNLVIVGRHGHLKYPEGTACAEVLKAGAPWFAPTLALDYMARHSIDFWLTSEDLPSPHNRVTVGRDGQIRQQVYHPAPQLPGLLRALYRINSVRAGLYGAAASSYGDAFAQMSRQATDTTAKRLTAQMAAAYSQGGAQLTGYSSQASALASKRFKASLATPGSVFMLTRSPDGNGNVLLQIDKDSAQPRSRVDLGKQREPVYAVDDIAGMLFLQTTSGTLAGYRL